MSLGNHVFIEIELSIKILISTDLYRLKLIIVLTIIRLTYRLTNFSNEFCKK